MQEQKEHSHGGGGTCVYHDTEFGDCPRCGCGSECEGSK